jgi:hypothetical protein
VTLTLHNLGENGILGVKADLFGGPLSFHPQSTHAKLAKSATYPHVGEMGEMGEFTRHRVGEMGESPRGLTHSPMPATVPDMEQFKVVSIEQQSPVITLARQLRSRFGQGVRLTFHVDQGRTQGRQPYWWGCVDA